MSGQQISLVQGLLTAGFDQTVTATADNTSAPGSLTINGVTHGRTLALIISRGGGGSGTSGEAAPAPPTDSTGQTWQMAIGPDSVVAGSQAGYTTQTAIYYLLNAKAGVHVVTPGTGPAGSYWDLTLVQLPACYGLDVTKSAADTAGPSSLGTGLSAATTVDSELVVASLSVEAATGSASAGITHPATFAGFGGTALNLDDATNTKRGGEASYKTTSNRAVQSASWSWTAGAVDVAMAVLAAFKLGSHGQFAEANAGSVGGAVSVALVGAAIALSQGIANPNSGGIVPLTGSAVAMAQGTTDVPQTRALTGSATTSALQTLAIDLRPTDITLPAIATAAGTLTAAGPAAGSAHLSGVEAAFDQGFVNGGYTVITGQDITGAQTTPAYGLALPITGVSASFSLGAMVADQSAIETVILSFATSPGLTATIALAGSAATSAQGSVALSGDVFQPLAGSASTLAAGTAGAEKDFALAGQQFTAVQYNIGAPGTAVLTGAQINSAAGAVHLDNDRTYALTGQVGTAQSGIAFASPLAFATGEVLAVSAGVIGDQVRAATSQVVTMRQGTLSAEIDEPDQIKKSGVTRKKTDDEEVLQLAGLLVQQLKRRK
jgi:hypothetical protein